MPNTLVEETQEETGEGQRVHSISSSAQQQNAINEPLDYRYNVELSIFRKLGCCFYGQMDNAIQTLPGSWPRSAEKRETTVSKRNQTRDIVFGRRLEGTPFQEDPNLYCPVAWHKTYQYCTVPIPGPDQKLARCSPWCWYQLQGMEHQHHTNLRDGKVHSHDADASLVHAHSWQGSTIVLNILSVVPFERITECQAQSWLLKRDRGGELFRLKNHRR